MGGFSHSGTHPARPLVQIISLSPPPFDGIRFQYMVFLTQRLYDRRKPSGGKALKEVPP